MVPKNCPEGPMVRLVRFVPFPMMIDPFVEFSPVSKLRLAALAVTKVLPIDMFVVLRVPPIVVLPLASTENLVAGVEEARL